MTQKKPYARRTLHNQRQRIAGTQRQITDAEQSVEATRGACEPKEKRHHTIAARRLKELRRKLGAELAELERMLGQQH